VGGHGPCIDPHTFSFEPKEKKTENHQHHNKAKEGWLREAITASA
jgi:hypothetical protein